MIYFYIILKICNTYKSLDSNSATEIQCQVLDFCTVLYHLSFFLAQC